MKCDNWANSPEKVMWDDVLVWVEDDLVMILDTHDDRSGWSGTYEALCVDGDCDIPQSIIEKIHEFYEFYEDLGDLG